MAYNASITLYASNVWRIVCKRPNLPRVPAARPRDATDGCPAAPATASGRPTDCNGATAHGATTTAVGRTDRRSDNRVGRDSVVAADFGWCDGTAAESRVAGSPTAASGGAWTDWDRASRCGRCRRRGP